MNRTRAARSRSAAPGVMAALAAVALAVAPASGCKPSGAPSSPGPERAIADAAHLVLSADREVYAEQVVHRLQNVEKVFKASERWEEDRALPLPAQMFRMGAERARKLGQASGGALPLSYALLSLWPINRQNAGRTAAERAGLQAVKDRPEQPHYQEEELAGKRYLTAVYPDRAVSQSCVSCHNEHPESPRTDFALGDVMGGVVIRVAIQR